MPKKIPTNFDVEDPKSIINKARKKETAKQKGSGGIAHETKEYKKELKSKSGKKGYEKKKR